MRIRTALAIMTLLFLASFSARAQSPIAQTPPMGWNSWNHFACKVTAADVRGAADAITRNGMKDAGYVYVNVDDCWQAGRDEQGRILASKNFGDMKALADYVHSKGLKFGIYGKLPARRARRSDLRGVGRRLSEIRLVQRIAGLSGQPNQRSVRKNAQGVAKDWASDCVQLVPIRLGFGLAVGQRCRRKFVADDGRH